MSMFHVQLNMLFCRKISKNTSSLLVVISGGLFLGFILGVYLFISEMYKSLVFSCILHLLISELFVFLRGYF
jgi:hypothetical protein